MIQCNMHVVAKINYLTFTYKSADVAILSDNDRACLHLAFYFLDPNENRPIITGTRNFHYFS